MKWKLDWIGTFDNNDVLFMFDEILTLDNTQNVNYCMIVHHEFADKYVDEMLRQDNTGIFTTGSSKNDTCWKFDCFYIGKLVTAQLYMNLYTINACILRQTLIGRKTDSFSVRKY